MMIKSLNRQKKNHALFEKTVKKFQNSIRLRFIQTIKRRLFLCH